MTTAIIVAVGALFFVMGSVALIAPAAAMRQFGIELRQPAARSEVRAVYGGFGLAIAAILGYAVAAPGAVRTGILLTVGAALAGMALGRILGAPADGRTPFFPNWCYGLIEVVAAVALFLVA